VRLRLQRPDRHGFRWQIRRPSAAPKGQSVLLEISEDIDHAKKYPEVGRVTT